VTNTRVACPSCGYDPTIARQHCGSCGASTTGEQPFCHACGASLGVASAPVPPVASAPVAVTAPAPIVPASGAPQAMTVNISPPPKSRVVAAILAILLSIFAAHKWYLGKKQSALIMNGLVLVGFCGGAVLIVPFLIVPLVAWTSIAEGIIYLTKTDEQFQEIYIVQGRDWF
jgi:hypothetical protein